MNFATALTILSLSSAPVFADQWTVPESMTAIVMKECADHGIPLYIAAGLLWSESSGRMHATTEDSAGPWQLNRIWHKEFRWRYNGGRDFSEFDPVATTHIALGLLHDLWVLSGGKWARALEMYKCGPRSAVPKNIRLICKKIVRGEDLEL